jgi:hypothetical protein
MNKSEKIIIFSNPRWGTTYISDSILRYFKTKYPEYDQVTTEYLHTHYSESLTRVDDNVVNQLKKIHDIDIVSLMSQCSETTLTINEIFHNLINKKIFVYKYFQHYSNFFSIDNLSRIDQSIRIIPLIRKNILNTVISQIVVDHTGVWNIFGDEQLPKINNINLDLVYRSVEWTISQYSDFGKNLSVLKKNRHIDDNLYYENLTFNTEQDLTSLFSNVPKLNFKFKRIPKKIVDQHLKEFIISQIDVEKIILDYIENKDLLCFEIDDNYNVNFT